MLNKLLIFIILSVLSLNTFAQDKEDDYVVDHKNDLLVVVGGGLAGAVLGLSTLSFVEEPKDHTRNIVVGAAIGIIAGVAYVAFNQANQSKQLIMGPQDEAYFDPKEFDTNKRVAWHYDEVNSNTNFSNSLNQVNYSFKF